MRILVTGSSGLIGSEVAEYFLVRGEHVIGIDNNQRAIFFGPEGDTRWRKRDLERHAGFRHYDLDVRNREALLGLLGILRPDVIVHAAAQPSHDLAARIPFDDFDTNAVGTLNMLEAARQTCSDAPFVYMSTNKVYGDGPNRIPLREAQSRWLFDDHQFEEGIDETFPIDRCLHSLFGASKLAADILVQEYGRYFDLPTCCIRGGCLTGPYHCGVELHGFLSYLVKCNLEERRYRVFGYKGKQVRDNIHSMDVARFIEAFIAAPRPGEVYNIGGGRVNSCSILEAFDLVQAATGKPMQFEYVDENRIGDHICYYSNLRKARAHYPNWDVTVTLPQIVQQIVEAWESRPRV